MNALLSALVYWHWLILGVLLMIAETMAPGSFLLWIGVGAVLTGGLLYVIPELSWQVQLIVFALLSLASIIFWRRHRAANPDLTSHPTLNQRGLSYVGRRFTLSEPIVDGVGRLHVDDTTWRIEGDDLPAATTVVVVAAVGTALRVTRAG
ncbi:MAG: NfeD family protein [Gammaproteobacteria bacterium]